MNEEHEKIIAVLEREITPVKMKRLDLLKIFAVPIGLGILARSSDFTDLTAIYVLGGIFAVLFIIVLFFVTQCVDIGPDGILISGPLRKTTELKWDEITQLGYNRRVRSISIRGPKGIAYFNSMDGLDAAHDLALVVAYRTGYKCSPTVKAMLIDVLDNVDYDHLISMFENTNPEK